MFLVIRKQPLIRDEQVAAFFDYLFSSSDTMSLS